MQNENKTFDEWLKEQDDYGIMAPPMDAETAIDFLRRYLLGEDWYSPNPVSSKQINTEIVYLILRHYSKRYREERKGDKETWLTKALKALRSWMRI